VSIAKAGPDRVSAAADRKRNVLAAVGLALGAVFGLAGTMVTQPTLQQVFWAIDSAGLVMATALLCLKFFRKGNELIAAGFLVFALGESVILSGTAAGAVGSIPAFAAGTALWATALLLVSIPKEFALPIRIVGVVAAVLFIVTSFRIFAGEPLSPTASPLPFFAYPVLVLTFLGWIWSLMREAH
jgi:hypothetical protein